ncbi:MAG TPA: MarR family transcriptional regulator [Chitinophagaceae bacterium]|nr:MarR family transcriptional regulator [Chitinophagaceae bacterium]
MPQNIINQLGELAIGARMRRLYDVLSRDVMKIYEDNGLDFETKHFTLFYLVSQREGIGIMEIADELSLTHPAIIHLAKELEKKGYIESVKSPGDNRKRLLRLSKKGKKSLPAFQKVWDKITRLNKKLVQSRQHNLLKALEEMESLLEEQSYYKRFEKF